MNARRIGGEHLYTDAINARRRKGAKYTATLRGAQQQQHIAPAVRREGGQPNHIKQSSKVRFSHSISSILVFFSAMSFFHHSMTSQSPISFCRPTAIFLSLISCIF